MKMANFIDTFKWRQRTICSKYSGCEPWMSWPEASKVCFRISRLRCFLPFNAKIEVLKHKGNLLLVRMPYGRELFYPKEQPLEHLDMVYRERSEISPVAVKAGDWVIQVGAAEGYFGLSVQEKAGKVYLVEPLPQWRRCLEKTFRRSLKQGKVEILPYALGEEEKRVPFYVPQTWFAGLRLSKEWAKTQSLRG